IPGGYEIRDLKPEEFVPFISNLAGNGYIGGNVSLPHKEAAYRTVAARDAAAEAVGAVNTLWLQNRKLMGRNSELPGFDPNLDDHGTGWNVPGCKVVILGAGGASRSAVYAFRQRGIEVHIVNRTVGRAQELAQRFGASAHAWNDLGKLLPQADVLVNCTSLGMQGKDPLQLDLLPL